MLAHIAYMVPYVKGIVPVWALRCAAFISHEDTKRAVFLAKRLCPSTAGTWRSVAEMRGIAGYATSSCLRVRIFHTKSTKITKECCAFAKRALSAASPPIRALLVKAASR